MRTKTSPGIGKGGGWLELLVSETLQPAAQPLLSLSQEDVLCARSQPAAAAPEPIWAGKNSAFG